jgi:hypothetical protein
MFPENLMRPFKSRPPMFQQSPCALELLATHLLHSGNGGTISQLCGAVLLCQLDLYWAQSVILLTDLDDLRSAFSAPGAHNRINASAARALNVQFASRYIGFSKIALLRRLIFDHNDGVRS